MRAAPQPPVSCAECGHPLATDQGYCVACGARRGALPPGVAVAIGDLATRHQPPPAPVATEAPAHPGPAPSRPLTLVPLAGALAVCVLLMLGVGSVLGAASTPGGITSLANTIVVSLSPSGRPAAARLADSGSRASSRGGVSPGGAGGGAGAAAAAPAPQTARTVTVSATGGQGGATTSPASATTPKTPPTRSLPPIHHVWEIVLSGQGYDQSFGNANDDPYLARTLANQGTVIADEDAVATSPLANEIALISGQGPTIQTLQDCPQYSDITPGQIGRRSQALGAGCLYPAGAETIGSELQVGGLRWRAYVQGIGDPGQRHPTAGTTTTGTATTGATTTGTTTGTSTTGTSTTGTSPGTTTAASGTATTTAGTTPASTSTSASTSTTTAAATAITSSATSTSTTASSTSASGPGSTTAITDTSTAAGCPHPAEGAVVGAQTASAGDGYVTWKNPWVYFRSELAATTCARDDTGIGQLARDLRHTSTTPALSYIAPDPCDDGSDTPCRPGARAGLARADAFLKTVVPKIERSAAYRDDGLILITFAEGPQSGPDWSTASCCGEPAYPNLRGAATTSPTTTSTSSATTTTTCTATTPTTPTIGTTTPTTTTTTTPTATTTTSAATTCGPATTGDPPGGGQVGLLMISPYVPAAKINEVNVYNHFSVLKTISQLFGVTPLGYADLTDVPSLSPTLFTMTRR